MRGFGVKTTKPTMPTFFQVKMHFLLFALILAKQLHYGAFEEEIGDDGRGNCDKQDVECAADEGQRSKYAAPSENQKNLAENAEYYSYLDYPRLTFSGYFQANTPTLNNFVENYNISSLTWGDVSPERNWNPWGSGEWGIVANVTNVCYGPGDCTKLDGDSIIGKQITNGGIKTPAKIATLDVQVETFTSEIWGWRVRVGDFFSGAFKTAGQQYTWLKMIGGITDRYMGVAYQSVLTDVVWTDSSDSRFINQLHDVTGSGYLSIRFNLDMVDEQNAAQIGLGRITGSIGPSGNAAPPFVTIGRMLKARVPYTQDAPFKLDESNKRCTIDFGNSLPINRDGSFDKTLLGNLTVALIPPGFDDSEVCSSIKQISLGEVNYSDRDWYKTTAGIEDYAINIMEGLSGRLLVVREFGNSRGCEIVLSEDKNSKLVLPFSNWIQRVEPTDQVTFDFIATKAGRPLPNSEIELHACNCSYVFKQGLQVGKPNLKIPATIITDAKGNARLQIDTVNPGNPRDQDIDGQLYGYVYCIPGTCPDQDTLCTEAGRFELMKSMIVFRVFSEYVLVEEATWYKDVYPIFQQYAVLYPVMKNFFDLGNYYDVISQKKSIATTLELSREEPYHMPVTRDLSASRKNMLLDWLAQDIPRKGSPPYTVENLRRDLQIAIELEHSTIPPYLAAMASIKPGYNQQVYDIIKTVVVQEMLHLSLAANVLNAVGGAPKLYYKEFIPNYPSFLPGGVRPDLIVPIQKLSIGLIRNVFMSIEEPVITMNMPNDPLPFRNRVHKCSKEVIQYCKNNITRPEIENILKDLKTHRSNPNDEPCIESPRIPAIQIHLSTIGGFYNHILCSLAVLSCPEGEDKNIFTGDESKQVSHDGYFGNGNFGHGRLFKVTNLTTAVDAIREIVKEGEGSSPCNPIAWSKENAADLSHYFLFKSIVETRGVQVCSVDEGNLSEQNCSTITYNYTGLSIPFDPDGVWPMVPNPKMSKYAYGSAAYIEATMFNKVYTRVLFALENLFNRNSSTMGDAVSVMHSMVIHMNKLMATPIHEGGDPDVGPNAGPTYDFTP